MSIYPYPDAIPCESCVCGRAASVSWRRKGRMRTALIGCVLKEEAEEDLEVQRRSQICRCVDRNAPLQLYIYTLTLIGVPRNVVVTCPCPSAAPCESFVCGRAASVSWRRKERMRTVLIGCVLMEEAEEDLEAQRCSQFCSCLVRKSMQVPIPHCVTAIMAFERTALLQFSAKSRAKQRTICSGECCAQSKVGE